MALLSMLVLYTCENTEPLLSMNKWEQAHALPINWIWMCPRSAVWETKRALQIQVLLPNRHQRKRNTLTSREQYIVVKKLLSLTLEYHYKNHNRTNLLYARQNHESYSYVNRPKTCWSTILCLYRYFAKILLLNSLVFYDVYASRFMGHNLIIHTWNLDVLPIFRYDPWNNQTLILNKIDFVSV